MIYFEAPFRSTPRGSLRGRYALRTLVYLMIEAPSEQSPSECRCAWFQNMRTNWTWVRPSAAISHHVSCGTIVGLGRWNPELICSIDH
jgi:hypothetical protein